MCLDTVEVAGDLEEEVGDEPSCSGVDRDSSPVDAVSESSRSWGGPSSRISNVSKTNPRSDGEARLRDGQRLHSFHDRSAVLPNCAKSTRL